MAMRLVSRFVLRAPLLPARALARAGEALLRHPLGTDAVALASPDLTAALGQARPSAAARAALDRYGRRAAFRPTPHGLLAGASVGTLGARTEVHTRAARAHIEATWQRVASITRAWLEDASVREQVRLRAAPSLLIAGGEALWLALTADRLEPHEAEVDDTLAAVVAATPDWTPWPRVRASAGEDDHGADDYLLMLVDQGLLHHDLAPPIVGPPPLAWLRERVAALGDGVAVDGVRAAADAAARGDRATLERALDALGGTGRAVNATLVHEHARAPTLSRAAVVRAAEVAPLLFRLQQALAPPAEERALGTALGERLAGLAEVMGAGAYELPSLATGDYGVALGLLDEDAPASASPPPGVLAYLAALLTEAARAGAEEVVLDPEVLDGLLPAGAPPPSFELVLAPCREPPGARAGTGWRLGLHAPAGASWGRHAHALGAPLSAALDELAATEAAVSDEQTVDVVYAASTALADLCVHPQVRRRALALAGWPAGEALGAAALALGIDPGAPRALDLRDGDGHSLRPSPLHRVRSTTAPAGLYRLLAGWSLWRQHAPWALAWGAFGDLPRLPRVWLGGFVIAPGSWLVPPKAVLAGRGGLRRWRAAEHVPRLVEVGEGDELLPVDLDAPGVAAELARHAGARAHEVWPPPARLVDRGGRRVEAVVAVVCDGEAPPATAPRGPVPPPARRPPAPGWTTYKLFGADTRQDHVLVAAVAPLVAAALGAREIDRWLFLRYVDGPGRREHLRLRVRTTGGRADAAFGARLATMLAPLRAAGDVVAVETAGYFPETARYGGEDALAAVERLFQLDSALVLRLLALERDAAAPPEADRIELAIRLFDEVARALGLDLASRAELAARRRAAYEAALALDERRALDAEHRRRKRRLASVLSAPVDDAFAPVLDQHAAAVTEAFGDTQARNLVVAALAPVLHLSAVRLCGARPDDEAAAFVLWARTLEGLLARTKR